MVTAKFSCVQTFTVNEDESMKKKNGWTNILGISIKSLKPNIYFLLHYVISCLKKSDSRNDNIYQFTAKQA